MPEQAISTGRPATTAPTTSRPYPPINWRSGSGSKATGWGFCCETHANNLDSQREVVRNERRQNYKNAPYGLVQEALFPFLPKDHPYYASVIGSHTDIGGGSSRGRGRQFFQLHYAPNNASLAIVGDIDPEKAKALVEKYFGPIPAGKPVPKVEAKTPPITTERRAIVGDQVELPRIYLAWITDPVFKQGDAECDLIARILGGGKSSRLYKRLVYEKQIAQDVQAQQYSLALGSLFTIESTAKPGVKPEAAGERDRRRDRRLSEVGAHALGTRRSPQHD